MNLYEKYRPKTFAQIIGHAKEIRQLEALQARGFGGRAFWISGPSGCGKTTIARIIGSSIADDWMLTEYDSADDFDADEIERLAETMYYCAPGKGGRVWIINEAHGLRKPIIRRLLGILERLPKHAALIFTTTHAGSNKLFEDNIDAEPLLSRCICLWLSVNSAIERAFAATCKIIARAEGLDGQPDFWYQTLAAKTHANFRAMLQAVESGQAKAGESEQ